MGCEAHGKTLGNGQWEEVIAPIDCSYYQIVRSDNGTFEKCSDPDDVNSISTRNGFAIVAPPPRREWRWNKGERITWVKSSVPLDLYFLR